MDKADEIAPVVAMLDRRNGPLVVKAPDLLQNGLEADAVLIHRPQLHLGCGEGGRYGLDERTDLFLKAAWAAGSAFTCRGRGLRRLPSRRTRYAQPSCTLTVRPSFWLILRRRCPTNPELAFRSWTPDHCRELGQLLRRKQQRRPMRVRRRLVDHAGGTLLVVAAGKLANPIPGIPRGLGDLGGGLAPRELPQDLPPTALVRFLGCPVAPLELVYLQMRCEANAS